jgi:hypothetical protein
MPAHNYAKLIWRIKPVTNLSGQLAYTTIMKPALVNVRKLGSFPRENLAAVNQAFQSSPQCVLRQTWLDKEEPDFAPGIVRVGWRDESLLVFAELTDADISTRATRDNEYLWQLGDAFEIFLRPDGQTPYLEFHIAPNNCHMQMRFADAQALERLRQTGSFAEVLVGGQLFSSQVWVRPEARRWFIFAEIPAVSVCEKVQPLANTQWHFSFSRYDYTRGREQPVISSTSAHAQPNFHRQQEWGVMQFLK